MGTVASTLLMQMLWNGSAAAKRAQTDIKGVNTAAKQLKGQRGILGGPGTQAAIIGGQNMLVGALAGYVTGGAAKQAFTAYADFDRRMTSHSPDRRRLGDRGRAGQGAHPPGRAGRRPAGRRGDERCGGPGCLRSLARQDRSEFLPAVAKTTRPRRCHLRHRQDRRCHRLVDGHRRQRDAARLRCFGHPGQGGRVRAEGHGSVPAPRSPRPPRPSG